MEITDLLVATTKNKASDLHITVKNPPVMRVNGDIVYVKCPPLEADQLKQMLFAIMTEDQRSRYESELEIDFSLAFGEEMRFRVNAFHTINGPAAVFRVIPTEILTLEQVGAPANFKELCELNKGLILVTGPTGSGKSTTLASMVDHINANYAKHILTIEDPVEFVHTSKQSLINHREVGASTTSFARALKSALREDPDIILVGEMRDMETIQLAMTAAETGHLVMGTLHTSSAPKTIDRIIDVFPAGEKEMVRAMLSVSLEAIITQTLIKKADGSGRVAAHEVLLATPAVRNLIREAKVPQIYSIMQMGSKLGMSTMKDSVYQLLENEVITAEAAKTAINAANDDDDEKKSTSTGGMKRQASGF